MMPRRVSLALLLVAATSAFLLAGCATGRKAAPPPPAAEPAPALPPTAVDPGSPEPDTARTATPPPALPGAVGAPWDTAARSRATRRAHVYPKGESALGRKLIAALPDPGGLSPSEGGPPPQPPPTTWPPAGTVPPPGAPVPSTPSAPAAGCWQAQLLATADRARADRVRAEAAALLGVEVSVVTRDGVHRVRAGGCVDAEAALRLVERARAEGWPEAFRVAAGS
jgi:hypothetical protein